MLAKLFKIIFAEEFEYEKMKLKMEFEKSLHAHELEIENMLAGARMDLEQTIEEIQGELEEAKENIRDLAERVEGLEEQVIGDLVTQQDLDAVQCEFEKHLDGIDDQITVIETGIADLQDWRNKTEKKEG